MATIKAATVGIGLVVKEGTIPLEVHGSGFFINPEGYVMTAAHVLDYSTTRYRFYKNEKKQETEVAIFSISYSDKLYLDTFPIDTETAVTAENTYPAPGSIIPTNLDVSIAKIKPKE